MSDRLRLALFGTALAAVFGVGAAIGAIAGPFDVGGTDGHAPNSVVTDHGEGHGAEPGDD